MGIQFVEDVIKNLKDEDPRKDAFETVSNYIKTGNFYKVWQWLGRFDGEDDFEEIFLAVCASVTFHQDK